MAQTRVGVRLRPTIWNGLQAYYTADNTPNDALGNYNGTLINGATYGTGIINNGFSFDGVNDYVDMGVFPFPTTDTPISVSLWVNSSNLSPFQRILGISFNTIVGLNIFINSSKFIFQLASGSFPNELRLSTVATFSNSVWHNLIITYDGSRTPSGLKIYVGGSLQSTTTDYNACASVSIPSTYLRIGGNAYYLNGLVDEIGIWNRVLTASEVTELYNSGAGKQYPN